MGETWTIEGFQKELEDLGEIDVQVGLAAGTVVDGLTEEGDAGLVPKLLAQK